MSPTSALNFLSMFTGGGGGGGDAEAAAAADGDVSSSSARHSLQLQSCTHAALFVRMYRNLMNLFQDPRTHQQQQQHQQQQLALRSLASPVSPLYQMVHEHAQAHTRGSGGVSSTRWHSGLASCFRSRLVLIPSVSLCVFLLRLSVCASALPHLPVQESSLHHCASQILELLRLSGQLSPDVTTAIFIDRFRYASLLST